MENKKIEWYWYVIIVLLLIVTVLSIEYDGSKKDNINVLSKDTVKENLNIDINREQELLDSLIPLLSAKTNSTYITNIYKQNELQNKNIANYNITTTDSIFKQNLLSAHRQYDYLFDTTR
jgi:hypothetical protein